MDFEKPSKTQFTIYSKSGCPNCLKMKCLLREKQLEFNIINCDEYIIEDKDAFLFFISEVAKHPCKYFPMIFYQGDFIGGYKEGQDFVDKILSFDETIDF